MSYTLSLELWLKAWRLSKVFLTNNNPLQKNIFQLYSLLQAQTNYNRKKDLSQAKDTFDMILLRNSLWLKDSKYKILTSSLWKQTM